MDQSSHGQAPREITQMRAVPLTCFRRSGERYTRHQPVEDEIARALGVPHIVWC